MKTIQEKAKDFAVEAFRGFLQKGKAHDLREAIKSAYIAGATEALASQWHDPKVELPKVSHDDTVLVKNKKGHALGMAVQEVYHVGDGIFNNPTCCNQPAIAWMYIPDLPDSLKKKRP